MNIMKKAIYYITVHTVEYHHFLLISKTITDIDW